MNEEKDNKNWRIEAVKNLKNNEEYLKATMPGFQ